MWSLFLQDKIFFLIIGNIQIYFALQNCMFWASNPDKNLLTSKLFNIYKFVIGLSIFTKLTGFVNKTLNWRLWQCCQLEFGANILTSISISLIIFLFFILGFQKHIALVYFFKTNWGYTFLKA